LVAGVKLFGTIGSVLPAGSVLVKSVVPLSPLARVPDAHLAALAIEHGLTVCSTDGDFARFPGVRWENPLRASS
jgi:predicted nucleic acid-binding protein